MTLSRKFLVLLGLVLVLCVASSFAAGRLVRSPAQVAADAAPPPPSILTSPVVEGYVTQAIVVRGSVTRGAAVSIDGVAPEGAESVLTGRPLRVGEKVRPGMVIAEVSYRPIIALTGRIPMIRDLSVGSAGPDVAQLQDAIQALGWDIHDTSGTFGPSTAAALEKLYESVGYSAPTQAPVEASGGDDVGSDDGQSKSGTGEARLSSDGSAKSHPREVIVARKSELALINHLPGTVSAISAPVGGPAGDALVTISTAPPTVRASLAPAQRSLVQVGDEVMLSSASPAYRARARIAHIGATVQDEQTKAFSVPLRLIPAKTPPAGTLDQGIQVKIAVQRHADSGMIVPVAAIYTTGDGSTAVLKVANNGSQEVTVQVLETGSGRARILSAEPNTISIGDRVRVGVSG